MPARAVLLGLAVTLSVPAVAQAWQRLPDAPADIRAFELSLAARDDGALAAATGNGDTRVRILRRGAPAWQPAQRYPRLTNHALLGGPAFTLIGERKITGKGPSFLFGQVFAASERTGGHGLRAARRVDRRPGWRAESGSLQAATNLAGRGIIGWDATRGTTPERTITPLQRRRVAGGRLAADRGLGYQCAAAANDRGDVLVVGGSPKGWFAQTAYADGRRSRRAYLSMTDCVQVAVALSNNGAAVIAWTSEEFDVGVSGDPIPQPVETVVRRRWGRFGRVRSLGTGVPENSPDEHPVVSAALDRRGRGLIAWRPLATPSLAVNRVRDGRIGPARALSTSPHGVELVGTASREGHIALTWGPIEPASATRPEDGPGDLRMTFGRLGSPTLSTEQVVAIASGAYVVDATLLVSRRPARLQVGWLTSDDKAATIGVARRRWP